MKTTAPLWQELENHVALEATTEEWRARFGEDDLVVLRPFLRPTGRLATTLPCAQERAGCHRTVVVGADDDVFARCENPGLFCGIEPVQRETLLQLVLDVPALLRHVGKQLRMDAIEPTTVAGLPRTWRLGSYRPAADREVVVHVTLEGDERRVEQFIGLVLARETRLVLLLTPATHVTEDASVLLRARGGAALRLVDLTLMDERGSLVAAPRVDDVLRQLELVVGTVQNTRTAPSATFDTPHGATWADVEIRFNDLHTVSVQVLGKRGVFHYAQMGMADGRTALPNEQWKLLYTFAEAPGNVLDWSNREARRRNKKRCEYLVADLRRFFGIEAGTPIAYSKPDKGWRAVVRLSI